MPTIPRRIRLETKTERGKLVVQVCSTFDLCALPQPVVRRNNSDDLGSVAETCDAQAFYLAKALIALDGAVQLRLNPLGFTLLFSPAMRPEEAAQLVQATLTEQLGTFELMA